MKKQIVVAHPHLESKLIISDDFVQVLVVENPFEFYNTVLDLGKCFDGEISDVAFSCDGEPINVDKYGALVLDMFHFEVNDKKLLNVFYKKVEEIAFGEKVVELNAINSQVLTYINDLTREFPFDVDYKDPQPLDYLKIAGLKINENCDSLEEKIILYINALIELKKCEFFVFINLKSVLSEKKLQLIYTHCQLEHVGLFLIENVKRPSLAREQTVYITDDLCEIVEFG